MELGERREWEGGKKEGERNILFNSRRESLEDLTEIEVFFSRDENSKEKGKEEEGKVGEGNEH